MCKFLTGKHMAVFRWTPQRRVCATYLAMGKNKTQVSKITGVSESTLTDWEKFPEWVAFTEEVAERHAETMEALLADAERAAIAAMMQLLESDDEDVRFKAAESVLNRAGKRGKPVDQMEQRSLSVVGDLDKAMQQALRDPGVMEKLRGANITVDVPRLPSGAEGEARSATRAVSPLDEEPDYEVIPHGQDA